MNKQAIESAISAIPNQHQRQDSLNSQLGTVKAFCKAAGLELKTIPHVTKIQEEQLSKELEMVAQNFRQVIRAQMALEEVQFRALCNRLGCYDAADLYRR